ncbi:glycosyltransferase family 2 protein [Arcanobacterium bovis]|uniref:glycosyltransferase family 2 protein n=1 Tax=Arcanobacterium bovis TaxID=2529275 RepID=UPI001F4FA05B|nr:glycosyltransferase family 2 protein [Arcanobacterium bovis]
MFNPGEELRNFCRSVFQAFSDARLSQSHLELVIVNNGSHCALLDELQQEYPVSVIDPKENLGYGRAANLGAQGFDGEWILVSNPDVVYEQSSIADLVEMAEIYPRGGVFGPKILTPEGEIYPSARRFPRLVSGIGHALLKPVWENNPFTKKYQENEAVDQAHEVDWLSGACLLIRSRAFREVGGFDDRFFMFFEDTMLGEALKKRNWSSIFVPNAVIVHDQGKSWRDRPAPMIRAHHESARTYLNIVYSKPYQWPLRCALGLGLKARAALLTRGK